MVELEFSEREAILAVGFVFLTIVAIALVQSGVITNPLTLGLMVTLTIGLIFVGHSMAGAGIISRSAVPLWYIFTFGVVMLVYGGIQAGYIPIAFLISRATVMEIAITNAMFYTLIITAVVAAVAAIYAGYKYYKKRALGMI
ncbi:MAG: hypothetical protein DRJ60_00200 [Thermoprotei archaeon]|nr:MAG: hypothetical protein DRJ60_00200 [Thermoprotei archaeon]